jgi:hypothetical protein
VISFVSAPALCAEEIRNGFILSDTTIPIKHIVEGGPPRDGIPSLDDPAFVSAKDVDFLDPRERVLGIAIENEAKAYPIKILNWHEVVNDRIGEQFLVVTFCPLCGSGVVFATNAEDDRLVFGVSGLLYNNNVLLYDRNTESLWPQLMGKAVTGPLEGVILPQLVATHTTWGAWLEKHPETRVLSTNTGYRRNYDESPYAGYENRPDLYFALTTEVPETYHPKEAVLGIRIGGLARAYPFLELERRGEAVFDDAVGIRRIRVHWDVDSRSAWATDAKGNPLPTEMLYWFAWYSFNPETSVYRYSE